MLPLGLQIRPNLIRFNLTNMRFTAVIFVALAAVTSSFALSKKGGDGESLIIFPFPSEANALVRTGTWFHPGLGSCGHHNTDNDLIVAVDAVTIQSFPGATANPNKHVSRIPSFTYPSTLTRTTQQPHVRPQDEGDLRRQVRCGQGCGHMPRQRVHGRKRRHEPRSLPEARSTQRRPSSRRQLDPPLRR